jgi:hypothetical protein
MNDTTTNDGGMRSEQADSGRSADQKNDAEVLSTSGPAGDPDVFLVEYPDGSQEYEPATPTNVALFQDGLYSEISGITDYNVRVGDRTVTVTLTGRPSEHRYVITVDDISVVVPTQRHDEVISAVRDNTGALVGTRLYQLYRDIANNQVRRDVVEQFLSRYDDDRVLVTENGWVIDDTFIVTYEAENYLTGDDPIYERSGGDMEPIDESKPAVGIEFDVDGEEVVQLPDVDNTVRVGETEQVFLATVEALLYPEDYLNVELVDEVRQHRSGDTTQTTISEIADTGTVHEHTDSKTRNWHNHGFDKHRAISEAQVGNLDSSLGMTERAVDMLVFNDYDHAAPHELLYRQQEFEQAPFDIFEADGVANDDSSRWTAIERAADSAPLNDEHHQQMQAMFGNR